MKNKAEIQQATARINETSSISEKEFKKQKGLLKINMDLGGNILVGQIKLRIKVDGVKYKITKQNPLSLELNPGSYNVACYFRRYGTYTFKSGKCKATVNISDGCITEYLYKVPFFTFMKGKLLQK